MSEDKPGILCDINYPEIIKCSISVSDMHDKSPGKVSSSARSCTMMSNADDDYGADDDNGFPNCEYVHI